jgi:hypothetical protein
MYLVLAFAPSCSLLILRLGTCGPCDTSQSLVPEISILNIIMLLQLANRLNCDLYDNAKSIIKIMNHMSSSNSYSRNFLYH